MRAETRCMQLISLGLLLRHKTESELQKVSLDTGYLLDIKSYVWLTHMKVLRCIFACCHMMTCSPECRPVISHGCMLKLTIYSKVDILPLTSHMFFASSTASSCLAGRSLMFLQQGGHLSGFRLDRPALKHHVHTVYRCTWTLIGPPFAVNKN